jgi:pimeloyl-ACP methyl ester carboxylesterase
MLAFHRRGKGPPLLLLHGLGGTRIIWDPVIELLAAEREVLAPDMPGFGASDPLAEAPTAVNLAAAVARFCSEQGIERPHVAGNSLGAWVALEMAKQGAASSVTGLSPAGLWREASGLVPGAAERRRRVKQLRPLVHLALYSGAVRRRALQTTMAYPERVPPREARLLVLEWIDSRGYEDANREMRSTVFDPAGFPADVPVTIAWGERDTLVRRPRQNRMPAGARSLVLPDCGHTPTWDNPELVAKVLLEGSSKAGGGAGRAEQMATGGSAEAD